MESQKGLKHVVAIHQVYKYELDEDCGFQTPIQGVEAEVEGGWVRLLESGLLLFKKGYSYNGASGPTYDSASSLAPSLVHDGGYQLISEANLSRKYRKVFDKLFLRMLKENGMSFPRRTLWYLAVRAVGWMYV